MKNFWHIQLHPDDRANFTPEVVLRLLNEQSVIGIGEGWENDGGQPDHFQNWMQLGDIVTVRDGGTPIALVEVTGPCEQNGKQTDICWFDLIRKVKILSITPPPYKDRYFYMTSCSLQREVNPAFVRFWYNKVKEDKQMEDLTELLKHCHNLILTGAPGTGKTYLAMALANAMTGDSKDTPAEKRHTFFVQFHPSYDYADFVEGLRPTQPNKDGNIGFVRQDGTFKAFCKRAIENQSNNFKKAFQSLMNDLIENHSKANPLEMESDGEKKSFKVYKRTEDSLGLLTGDSGNDQGSLTAEKIESFLTSSPCRYWPGYYRGVLKYLRQHHGLKASAEPADQKYVFIIDEINRGDIAKIFGELFFALDPGYRGQKEHSVKTQYSNLIEDEDIFKDGFYIPSNVYIIGTMNDIDRNVESMDFAIRRRFTWKRISPEDTQDAVLSGLGENIATEAKKRMKDLNTAIRDEKSQLGENFCIGAAYFKKVGDTPDKWVNLWNYHLKPLLEEYVRGLPDAEKMLTKFEDAYNGKVQADANTSVQG